MPADLLSADLLKSALPADAARRFNILPLPANETLLLTGVEVPAGVFIYHDPDGTERNFIRLKYLEKPPENAWTRDNPDQGKYWQPPASGSHLYFPLSKSWTTTLANPDIPIYITEGEKKAICGVFHGLPMLAVAGVNNWRSSRHFNQSTIPDLDLIEWSGRTVYLSFDADAVTNPHVAKALSDLSIELTARGVRSIRVIELPATTSLGTKIGLDDYIAAYGFKAYEALVDCAANVKATQQLWKMNERFAFIDTMSAVYDNYSGYWHKRAAFFDMTAPLTVERIRVRGAGEEATATVVEEPANKLWWEWPHRRSYDDHVYAPGSPQVVHDVTDADVPSTRLNTWCGWGTTPASRRSKYKPFLRLFETLTTHLTPKERRWFLRWLAWPIQHPTQGKQATAVLLHSRTQGTGKSYLGELMCELYGANALTIASSDELFGPHAAYLEKLQFVVADEVLVGTRSEIDRVKNLVSATSIVVNPKGLPAYKSVSWANWYFTSNHSDSLKIDDQDRRWFICHVPEEPLDPELITELRAWRADGGVAGLHRYLLDVDLRAFQPWERPPVTAAKLSMVEASLSETEVWCHTLTHDPDSILSIDGVPLRCDLFTEADWRSRGILPHGFRPTVVRNYLRTLGYEQRRRMKSRHWSGEKYLWCLRNRELWSAASNADWADHYHAFVTNKMQPKRHAPSSKVTPIRPT